MKYNFVAPLKMDVIKPGISFVFYQRSYFSRYYQIAWNLSLVRKDFRSLHLTDSRRSVLMLRKFLHCQGKALLVLQIDFWRFFYNFRITSPSIIYSYIIKRNQKDIVWYKMVFHISSCKMTQKVESYDTLFILILVFLITIAHIKSI